MPHTDRILARADARPPPAFACTTTHGGLNAAWIDVVGELDIATAPQLARTLRESQQLAHLTVLDLRELAFMDCSGVHTSSTPASGPGRPAAAWYSCAAAQTSTACSR